MTCKEARTVLEIIHPPPRPTWVLNILLYRFFQRMFLALCITFLKYLCFFQNLRPNHIDEEDKKPNHVDEEKASGELTVEH